MEPRFGFIHDEMELKVLILYLLRRIDRAVPRNELTDATLLCDEGIGYFEFSDCLADLVRTEHVAEAEGSYFLTAKGIENGAATADSIPYSVRIRAEKAASATRQLIDRSSLIKTGHELRQLGGLTVHLALSDGVGQLIDLSLLCGDEKQAERIEANFRRNAEKLYGKVLELMLGEELK